MNDLPQTANLFSAVLRIALNCVLRAGQLWICGFDKPYLAEHALGSFFAG